MRIILLFITLSIFQTIVYCQEQQCRFAPTYTNEEILNSNQSFINDIIYWEGNFHSNLVGVNFASGYTYDGTAINYATGEILKGGLHNFSAPSKESIHLGLLALALNEFANVEDESEYRAINFFHQNITRTPQEELIIPKSGNNNFDNAITILSRKINTYHQFNKQYPGYGGFHPWVSVNDSGISPIPGYWTGRVPGLDNGEMIWSIYAVYNILLNEPIYQESSEFQFIGQLYQTYFQLLVDNAMMIFYQPTESLVSAVVTILDIYAQPTPSNYQFDSGYLNDPYEGELLVVFMDLFCEWPTEIARDQIWINKRPLLQSVELVTPKGPITVQKGWWFSSHEQWKYLMLPYQEIEINKRVFRNGERARTWYSYQNEFPGLFASVTNVTTSNSVNNGYVSAVGIPEIAFQIGTNALITPYASFPLFLIQDEPSLGLSWYHTMINGPSMQNPYGSTESVNLIGTEISPVITWDSKITTVLSMLGGLSELNLKYLNQYGQFPRFEYVINREWLLEFGTQLSGEDLPFIYPSTTIPNVLNDFTLCN